MAEFINSTWSLVDPEHHIGLFTLLVGLFAIYLYLKQKKDHKRESASLILQEIRYAEQRVKNYRTYGSYSFAEKLLPTNSWHKNIHLFVRDFSESEIDIISKFFSNAEYLDDALSTAADIYNKRVLQPQTPDNVLIQTKLASKELSEPAQELLEGISRTIEYIYNTPVIHKLKEISEKRWYAIY
jgi:hypothetical protein